MRRAVLVVGLVGLLGCEAFTSDVDVVAKAGDYELTVERLAEIMANGKGLPLEPQVVRRLAYLWVDYSLMAQRIAQGDSMMDSALVMAAMWRDVQQRIADKYYDVVMEPFAELDSAAVDSIYRAGDLRLIKHVLVRVEPSLTPDERTGRQQRAQRALARLQSGEDWETINEEYNDDRSRANEGSIGVIERGDLVEAFERVAFSLAPGETSGLTETPFGYHVIRRPALDDVYEDFKFGVEDRFIATADTAFLDNFAREVGVDVRRDAPQEVREAMQPENLYRSRESGKVLATYEGGRLTLGDFMRWFVAFDTQTQQAVPTLDDDQLSMFISEVTTNKALIEQALEEGVELDEEDYQFFRSQYRDMMSIVRATMNITDASLGDSALTEESRLRQLEFRIDQYLQAIANNERRFVTVIPYLADELREGADVEVVAAAVDRTVERATALREELARVALPTRPGAPAEPGQADSTSAGASSDD